jgi:4-hydroxybenzoate polyprenyltransferase
LFNDLTDIDADRQHPKKRHRPLASGSLPVPVAQLAVVIFALVAVPASYLLNPGFLVISLIYVFSNLLYSRWFKHIPLLDVLLLAGFYVLRVGAGVTLIQVDRFSPWLYIFTTFLALYLGIGKRRAELQMMADNAGSTRRVLDGYTLPFLDQLIIIVSSMTVITYSLYTFSAPNLPENHAMMFTIPFLIYGIFRYLYLVQVEKTGDAPEEVFFMDRPLQVCLVLWGLAVLVIFYVF